MVDFLLVGPLTNFAMCINMYGSDFLDKVGNIWIMGGNYRGKLVIATGLRKEKQSWKHNFKKLKKVIFISNIHEFYWSIKTF